MVRSSDRTPASLDKGGVGVRALALGRRALWTALLSVVAACGADRGAATASDVGATYVVAIRDRDATAIKRVTPPDFEVATAVAEKLERFGGTTLNVSYRPHGVTPNIVMAELRDSDGKVVDEVMIQRFGTRWFLAIGYLPTPSGGPPTAAPSR